MTQAEIDRLWDLWLDWSQRQACYDICYGREDRKYAPSQWSMLELPNLLCELDPDISCEAALEVESRLSWKSLQQVLEEDGE